ncbi:MAG: hypothetical protein NC037_00265 [Bacteroides sp.]|nr:hypothetical protein [Bacillota bacterium]MCM1393748.1 hypothetical protein [[Eubacterium] siraeum]MCM1454951.1 hypothetical protein [Bacteroides sp.]
MAQVNLLKRNRKYTDKDGKERTATNFYLQVGNELIPVAVRFFENKDTGEDPMYRSRKMIMSAFADELPEKGKLQSESDDDLPF